MGQRPSTQRGKRTRRALTASEPPRDSSTSARRGTCGQCLTRGYNGYTGTLQFLLIPTPSGP